VCVVAEEAALVGVDPALLHERHDGERRRLHQPDRGGIRQVP
jgi:hypothetical protein